VREDAGRAVAIVFGTAEQAMHWKGRRFILETRGMAGRRVLPRFWHGLKNGTRDEIVPPSRGKLKFGSNIANQAWKYLFPGRTTR
jgi:hypothetical protein